MDFLSRVIMSVATTTLLATAGFHTKILSDANYETNQINTEVNPLTEIVEKLAYCESGNNPLAYNADDGGSPSYGLLQWKEGSFKMFVRKYKLLDDEVFDYPDWQNWLWDSNFQTKLTILVLKDGGWKNWFNCSKKLGIDRINMNSLFKDIDLN